ncbi:hypothetical protein [Lamprocystis purpurea]|jgi:hypothetical protein|uniref:hypothetical protein n=1 Tax=Lamprocystis purpurea TaxID=61598 RepID=UPI00037586AC|nr:hypothetical protein [Lamprocystis purpurea]
MKYHFFHIPALEPEAATEELNRLLAQYRILSVDRHLVADGWSSFWALSVCYADTETAPGAPGATRRVRCADHPVAYPTTRTAAHPPDV